VDTLTRESWARIRMIVKRRDKSICRYCKTLALEGEADHVVPLSKGGDDSLENLAWSCRNCNRQKYNRTPGEWTQHVLVSHKDKNAIEKWLIRILSDGPKTSNTIEELAIRDGLMSGYRIFGSRKIHMQFAAIEDVATTSCCIIRPLTYDGYFWDLRDRGNHLMETAR
jgi:hypothetical protein